MAQIGFVCAQKSPNFNVRAFSARKMGTVLSQMKLRKRRCLFIHRFCCILDTLHFENILRLRYSITPLVLTYCLRARCFLFFVDCSLHARGRQKIGNTGYERAHLFLHHLERKHGITRTRHERNYWNTSCLYNCTNADLKLSHIICFGSGTCTHITCSSKYGDICIWPKNA